MADLTFIEKKQLERLLRMEGGYILDFSNNTLSQFILQSTGKDIYDEKYNQASGSKAHRLRAFFALESNAVVGKLIEDLLEYRRTLCGQPGDETLNDEGLHIARRLTQPARSHRGAADIMSLSDDFGESLLKTRSSIDACVVVGGLLMVANYDNLASAVRRGVRIRLLFPAPHSDWLAPMIAAAGSDPVEYAARITTSAARARALGSAVEIRWYAAPTTTWFTLLDGCVVAHMPISFAAPVKPSITVEPEVYGYHQRLFDTLWASAEGSVPVKQSPSPQPTSVFCSYADEDRKHFDAFLSHLTSPLKHKLIKAWHRDLITPGEVRSFAMARQIEMARATLLLLSAHWFASNICQEEFDHALKYSYRGHTRIVPILLRSCRFEDSPRLAELAPLPRNRTAVTLWPDQDDAWTHIVNEIVALPELQ